MKNSISKILLFYILLQINNPATCQYIIPDNVYHVLLKFYYEKGHLNPIDVEESMRNEQVIADFFNVSEIIKNENTPEVGLFVFSHRFFEHPERGFIFHYKNKYHIFDYMVFHELIMQLLDAENIEAKKKIIWVSEIVKTFRRYDFEKQNPTAVFNEDFCRFYIPVNRLRE